MCLCSGRALPVRALSVLVALLIVAAAAQTDATVASTPSVNFIYFSPGERSDSSDTAERIDRIQKILGDVRGKDLNPEFKANLQSQLALLISGERSPSWWEPRDGSDYPGTAGSESFEHRAAAVRRMVKDVVRFYEHHTGKTFDYQLTPVIGDRSAMHYWLYGPPAPRIPELLFNADPAPANVFAELRARGIITGQEPRPGLQSIDVLLGDGLGGWSAGAGGAAGFAGSAVVGDFATACSQRRSTPDGDGSGRRPRDTQSLRSKMPAHIADWVNCSYNGAVGATAHELGHAFGLQHVSDVGCPGASGALIMGAHWNYQLSGPGFMRNAGLDEEFRGILKRFDAEVCLPAADRQPGAYGYDQDGVGSGARPFAHYHSELELLLDNPHFVRIETPTEPEDDPGSEPPPTIDFPTVDPIDSQPPPGPPPPDDHDPDTSPPTSPDSPLPDEAPNQLTTPVLTPESPPIGSPTAPGSSTQPSRGSAASKGRLSIRLLPATDSEDPSVAVSASGFKHIRTLELQFQGLRGLGGSWSPHQLLAAGALIRGKVSRARGKPQLLSQRVGSSKRSDLKVMSFKVSGHRILLRFAQRPAATGVSFRLALPGLTRTKACNLHAVTARITSPGEKSSDSDRLDCRRPNQSEQFELASTSAVRPQSGSTSRLSAVAQQSWRNVIVELTAQSANDATPLHELRFTFQRDRVAKLNLRALLLAGGRMDVTVTSTRGAVLTAKLRPHKGRLIASGDRRLLPTINREQLRFESLRALNPHTVFVDLRTPRDRRIKTCTATTVRSALADTAGHTDSYRHAVRSCPPSLGDELVFTPIG